MTISDLLQHIIQKASSIIGLNSCNWQLIDRRRDYRPHCAFICSPDYQESVYSFYFMSDKNTVFTWLCIKIMNVTLFFFFMQVNIDSNDSTFQTYKYIPLSLVFAVIVRLWRRLTQLPTKDPFYQDHDAYLDKTTSISIYNCQLKILTVSLGLTCMVRAMVIVFSSVLDWMFRCLYMYVIFFKYISVYFRAIVGRIHYLLETIVIICFLWLYNMKYESIPPMQYITVKTEHLILHLIIFHVI